MTLCHREKKCCHYSLKVSDPALSWSSSGDSSVDIEVIECRGTYLWDLFKIKYQQRQGHAPCGPGLVYRVWDPDLDTADADVIRMLPFVPCTGCAIVQR